MELMCFDWVSPEPSLVAVAALGGRSRGPDPPSGDQDDLRHLRKSEVFGGGGGGGGGAGFTVFVHSSILEDRRVGHSCDICEVSI